MFYLYGCATCASVKNNVYLLLFTETDVLAFGLFVHMYLAPSLYVYV